MPMSKYLRNYRRFSLKPASWRRLPSWALSFRNTAAAASPMSRSSNRWPSASCARASRGTTSWSSSRRWETPPTSCSTWRRRSRPLPIAGSSTCCSPRASASRWRCSRIAIRELGGDAISFTGSQSGIITSDRHVDARIIEVRPFRVQDELARGKIVVIAGFQGVSYRKEVTTLGRGGSDTTAVAMAAALNADYCEICSDVDGVYSADPRVVHGGSASSARSPTRKHRRWPSPARRF